MNILELQYATSLSSRLERFKISSRNPYKLNFRCPFCADSQKSKSKARGWLLENSKSQSFYYFCHNCGESLSFHKFLKQIDESIYKDFLTSSFKEKIINARTDKKFLEEEQTSNFFTETQKILKNTAVLNKIRRITQLKEDHPARIYIENRKIPKEQHNNIYYCSNFSKWINEIIPDKLNASLTEPRIVLPFLDENGEIFGVSGRGFDPKGLRYITIMFKEKTKIFGLDRVDFDKKYIIVEGAIDSLFLENCIAMIGANVNSEGLKNIDNAIYCFDIEPRNKEIHQRMEKIIKRGNSICVWPKSIAKDGKDINDLVLAGYTSKEIKDIITKNTFSGLEAELKLVEFKNT